MMKCDSLLNRPGFRGGLVNLSAGMFGLCGELQIIPVLSLGR